MEGNHHTIRNKALVILALLFLFGSCDSGPRDAVQSVESTIKGVDVSHHNGVIDWKKIAEKDGMQFVFIKATEGTTVVDGMFSKNR